MLADRDKAQLIIYMYAKYRRDEITRLSFIKAVGHRLRLVYP